MQAGDLLFGQLVTVDGITVLEACAPVAIPPGQKLRLIDLHERIERLSSITPEALLDWDIELREEYLAIMDEVLHPRLPTLQNTDGEALVLQQLFFDVDSAQDAFDALKPRPCN
jgi:hypothetical protein